MRMQYWGLVALACLSPLSAEEKPKYLDVTTVRVKPDKHADFEALLRKAVDANRRFKGDQWITWATVYGTGGTYDFTSRRGSLGEVEAGNVSFERALKEALGPAVAGMGHDFDSCIESSRSEIRRWRYEFARNVPETTEEWMRTVGNTRWVRTTRVEVRRGKVAEFEAALPEFLDAMYRRTPKVPLMVSQTVIGGDGEGIAFQLATYFQSMADMDAVPGNRESMGDELYRKFEQMNGEAVIRVSSRIIRPLPELSNPPETIVSVSRDFWMPAAQPMTAARKAKKQGKPPKEAR